MLCSRLMRVDEAGPSRNMIDSGCQPTKISAHAHQGAATLDYAKWSSNSGRKVPYVVIGDGPTAVMIIAQQHGDEMETSDSAVNLVRTLSNNSMQSRAIRKALKVIVVPRVNVDGFDGTNADGTPLKGATGTAVPPWRQNWDPRFTTNPLPAFYQRGRGYDINRYHGFRPGCPLDNPGDVPEPAERMS